MIIPIRLYRRATDGSLTECLEPGAHGSLLYGAGAELVDSEADRTGVTAYLRRRADAKMVRQAQVEDKALRLEEVEDKSLYLEERGLAKGPSGRFIRKPAEGAY